MWAAGPGGEGRVLRIVVALGDPERERALVPALSESGDFAVVDRPLSAEQLQAALAGPSLDVALVSSALHRLDPSTLQKIAALGVPVLLLLHEGERESWTEAGVATLDYAATAEAVTEALVATAHGRRASRRRPTVLVTEESARQAAPNEESVPELGQVVFVMGAHGGAGATTVATALAASMGTSGPTALADLDLQAPSLLPLLDLDPTRNLHMLSHASPRHPAEWEQALGEELQPLHADLPHALVLAGLPRPEMRPALNERVLRALPAELARRYAFVVVDLGALPPAELTAYLSRLGDAPWRLLLVGGADLVSLWHTSNCLRQLEAMTSVARERVWLVLNRHEGRFHHPPEQIAWTLGWPVAAAVPADHAGAARAREAQRPPFGERGSKAGKALAALALCLRAGQLGASTGNTSRLGALWGSLLAPLRGQARRGGKRGERRVVRAD